uniref:Small ribosomal subunit protein uS2 n=1 Tax=Arcella intermedia TaxID=1963864 RepID=A0A6B2LDQ9_9EUKA
MQLTEEDAKALIACGCHLGSENLDATMTRYVHKKTTSGVHIIDIKKTWEKIVLAARVIVAIENTKDICVVALSPAGSPSPAQRAILKFANHIGCRSIAGRMSPGTFTNHHQIHFLEPRLLVCSDARVDHQPIVEASYGNIPIISFTNTHHSTRGIDIAIPINTSGRNSIALGYWMLTREVLRLRQAIARDRAWNVMVDMFVYRDPEESVKQDFDADVRQADAFGEEGENVEDYQPPATGGEEGYESQNWGEQAAEADWAGEGGDPNEWAGTGGDWQ